MKQNLITDIVQGMLPYLNNTQSKRLQEVLQHTLVNYEVIEDTGKTKNSDKDFVELFMEHQDELDQIMEIVQQSFDAQAE